MPLHRVLPLLLAFIISACIPGEVSVSVTTDTDSTTDTDTDTPTNTDTGTSINCAMGGQAVKGIMSASNVKVYTIDTAGSNDVVGATTTGQNRISRKNLTRNYRSLA